MLYLVLLPAQAPLGAVGYQVYVSQMLKLARTIADLAEAETIAAPRLAEARQYRPRVDVG